MRVLILHPEDSFQGSWARERWDLIVDFGRAPKSFYDDLGRRLGCPIFSIFALAIEGDDMRVWRGLFELGMGRVVDRLGIDWWDVIGLLLQAELQNVRLVTRLAEQLRHCQMLVSSRPSMLAHALQLQLGVRLRVLQSDVVTRFTNRLVRYGRALSNLSFQQLRQVVYDKHDANYRWRRRFSVAPPSLPDPVVLLPTAYSNVSKTLLQYAGILPEQRFLMVLARESAALANVPWNITTVPLAAFSSAPATLDDSGALENAWKHLEHSLMAHPDFRLSVQAGILKEGLRYLPWGLRIRDAWERVFEGNNIVGCLSADDSNPYTRIPLLLAHHHGVPAVACHHGALDGRMAFKVPCYSTYLAQGEMERDYVERVCTVDPRRIRMGAARSTPEGGMLWKPDSPWIVFFTEPYETDLWRTEALYRDVLPQLCTVARKMGKTILMKLHPFETARRRRRLLRRILNNDEQKLVSVTDSPLSREILSKTWCAVTVESTVALECAVVGIPTFLCGWIRHAYTGYALQYVRFGVGRLLSEPNDLLAIPNILLEAVPTGGVADRLVETISPTELGEVLLQPVPRPSTT